MEKKRIYLIGPMRNRPLFNFPAFREAAASLRAMGYDVVSPHEMDEALGFREDHDPNDVRPDFLRSAMKRDCAAITECDYVALLPDWEQSTCGRVEASLAAAMGLGFVDATTGNSYHNSETVKEASRGLWLSISVAMDRGAVKV